MLNNRQIADIAPSAVPHAFVINMDGSRGRLAFITEQTKRVGLTFERISGTKGRDVPAWLKDEFDGPHELTPGEIGCYASHMRAAMQIVAQQLPYALILEDDAILEHDFAETICEAVRVAPRGWDMIHLSSVFKRTVVEIAPCAARRLVRHTRVPVNSAAYLLSNRGARKFLNPMPRVRPNDIDVLYWWQQGLDVYGVYPAPAAQSHEIPSDVGHVQGQKEKRNIKPALFKRALGRAMLARKIGVRTYVAGIALNIVNSARRRLDGKRRVAVLKNWR